jgi:hypothetical protein
MLVPLNRRASAPAVAADITMHAITMICNLFMLFPSFFVVARLSRAAVIF